MRISDWSSDGCSSDLAAIVEHDERLVEFLLGRDRLHEFNVFPDEIVGIIAEHFLCALVEECGDPVRSEEHTSELQSLMRISYAVFCLKKKNTQHHTSLRHANAAQHARAP